MNSIEKILFLFSCAFLGFILGFGMGECAQAGEAPKYKVAIIDTGFSYLPYDTTGFRLCKSGHYDFNAHSPTVGKDTIGHGSYVTGLVSEYAGTNKICFLIYKVFGKGIRDGHKAIDYAMIKAHRAGAKVINMSLYMYRPSKKTERIIKILTAKGIKIFVGAGNESSNLNDTCLHYPVCYKSLRFNRNMIVVGALNIYDELALYSNKGARIDIFSFGDIGPRFRGTSFAAPRALGKYIKGLGL